MYKPDLAPIVIFAYNRPAHLHKTIDALLNNINADKSDIYIHECSKII